MDYIKMNYFKKLFNTFKINFTEYINRRKTGKEKKTF
jgi:AraC-like DNA-binding protein